MATCLLWTKRVAAAALMGLFLSGCGSLMAMTGSNPVIPNLDTKNEKVYAGTKLDWLFLTAPFKERIRGDGLAPYVFAFPFFLIDLPLSIIADTVLLPYTVPHDNRMKKKRQELESEIIDAATKEPVSN